MPNFLVPIDLNKNELRQAQIQNLAAAPGSPVKGQIYMDTSSNTMYYYDGTVWQAMKSGTGGPPTGPAGGDLNGSTYPNPVIAASAVTYAKIQNVAATRLLGNPTGSAAAPAEIPLSADLAFSAGSLQLGAFTGDVTKAAGTLATTIASSAITYAKMQAVTAQRLLGNPTGSTAAPSEISLSVDLAFSGTALQVGAFTGDVTKSAGSLATTVTRINGTALSGLATGLLKNTTGTGVPSIAVAADIPTVAAGATGALSATDPSVTNSRAPTGTASGDLSGSYPGPTVFRINGTSLAALATGIYKNTTGTGVPSIAVAADIPVVAAGTSATGPMSALSRLDQIASANLATASVTLNSQKIINLLDPTNAQDAATKNYVDTAVQGLDAAQSCHAGSTANITGFSAGTFSTAPNTLDGVTLVVNDRVLLKNQTNAQENGIYTITTLGTGANGVWTRAADMNAWVNVPNTYVWVEMGTANADTGWVCTSDPGGTLNTTPITWVLFASAGTLIAGAGLTKTGNTIDFVTGDTSLTVAADSVVVNTAVIATVASVNTAVTGMVKKAVGTLAGSVAYATGESIAHTLNTRDVTVAVINPNTPWNAIEVDWEATDTTHVTVRYNSAVINPINYRVVITG